MIQPFTGDASRVALLGPAASIAGMVRCSGERAQRSLRLTRFLVQVSRRGQRAAYLADEEAAMAAADLSNAEREMVRKRDYPAMLAYGVNIYALAKAGTLFGHILPEIGRRLRQAATCPEENGHG